MRFFKRWWLAVSLALLQCFAITTVQAELNQFEQHHVVEIIGEQLPSLLQEPFEDFSLFAVRRGRLMPIPYQFDDYDEVGNVYFPDSGVPIVGEVDVLDGSDRLLFMMKDSGAKKTDSMRVDGKIMAEVALTTAADEQRYVYVVKGSRLRSDTFYVRYSKDLGHVDTDWYSIVNNPENALNWDEFKYFRFTGEQDSPLDTMKLRMKGGLVLPWPKISLNNRNFVARPYDERVGPIRATTQFRVTMYIFKIPILKFDMQIHYMPTYLVYSARVYIRRWQRLSLWGPTLSMSLDGNNLQGATIHTPLTDSEGQVDGKLSEAELEMIENGIDIDHNWILVSTGKNLDAIAFFEYIEPLDIPIKVHYVDSKTAKDKPERFPGQGPNVGYLVTDIPPKGFVGMRVTLFTSEGWKGEPEMIAKAIRKRPAVTITDLTTAN